MDAFSLRPQECICDSHWFLCSSSRMFNIPVNICWIHCHYIRYVETFFIPFVDFVSSICGWTYIDSKFSLNYVHFRWAGRQTWRHFVGPHTNTDDVDAAMRNARYIVCTRGLPRLLLHVDVPIFYHRKGCFILNLLKLFELNFI